MVPVERLKRFNFLASLDDEALAALAPKFHAEIRPRNECIFHEGDAGDKFYMIEAGQVAAARRLSDEREQFIGYFGPGEFFGTEAVLTDEPRLLTAEAVSQTALIYLNKPDFRELYESQPEVKAAIDSIRELRAHRRVATFPSKREEEALVFSTHRHWLWFGARVAALTIAIGALMVVAFFLAGEFALVLLALLALIYGALFVWFLIDWRNDWFILSSRRVLHHEQIKFLYERVEEAELDKIQNVTSDVLSVAGNLLDFGNVTIQTAAGQGRIVFDFIPHAREVSDAILSEQRRVKEHARQREITQMRQNIRKDLEREFGQSDEPPSLAPLPSGVRRREWAGVLRRPFAGVSVVPPTFIRKGNQLIWRRHVLLLYRDVFAPVVVLLLLLVVTPLAIFSDFPLLHLMPLPIALTVAVVGTGVSVGWLLYKYRDWENDIYVLTGDEVIDSTRKPFWLQERVRKASLERVQNITRTKGNFIENVFDFGTIVIQTGGEHGDLNFEEIPHPGKAQAEISQALERYREGQRQRDIQMRRQELLSWFGEYHRILGGTQSGGSSPPPGPTAST